MTTALPAFRPRAAHLSAHALARLRGLLADQLRANTEQVTAHDATARQLAGHTDFDSAIERQLALACAARAREAIGDIQCALGRLDSGAYGTCQACATPIPLERLEVIPHARLCVECPGRRATTRPGPSLALAASPSLPRGMG